MNIREKYIAEYLNKIKKKKFSLTLKERNFVEECEKLFTAGKELTYHQFNWLKDIAESLT